MTDPSTPFEKQARIFDERNGFSTPVPSDEAKRAAFSVMAHRYPTRDVAERTLTAAYAIDGPRLRAEARAATLREVEAWLRDDYGPGPRQMIAAALAAALAAHFNPEANNA